MRQDSADPLVMVVDDYDDVRSILRRWLEVRGRRVMEARDGREAVETAGREHPDLILMDLMMPEIDGFAATRRIRQIEGLEGVPIVAISAYGELGIDVQLQIDPQAVGFNEYVPKPFGPEQLFERWKPSTGKASRRAYLTAAN